MEQLPTDLRNALIEFLLAHDNGDPDRCLLATDALLGTLTAPDVAPLLLEPFDFKNAF
jgi:hypothetical protein